MGESKVTNKQIEKRITRVNEPNYLPRSKVLVNVESDRKNVKLDNYKYLVDEKIRMALE
jgi:hypothetical protein